MKLSKRIKLCIVGASDDTTLSIAIPGTDKSIDIIAEIEQLEADAEAYRDAMDNPFAAALGLLVQDAKQNRHKKDSLERLKAALGEVE